MLSVKCGAYAAVLPAPPPTHNASFVLPPPPPQQRRRAKGQRSVTRWWAQSHLIRINWISIRVSNFHHKIHSATERNVHLIQFIMYKVSTGILNCHENYYDVFFQLSLKFFLNFTKIFITISTQYSLKYISWIPEKFEILLCSHKFS